MSDVCREHGRGGGVGVTTVHCSEQLFLSGSCWLVTPVLLSLLQLVLQTSLGRTAAPPAAARMVEPVTQ